MKQKQTHRHKEQICYCQGAGRGGKEWEFGISRGKLLYIDYMNNKVILYSTRNHIKYSMTNHSGKEYEKLYMYIYIYFFFNVC